MATITSYTAARMKAIEDQAIVQGGVIGDNLILTRYNGVQIDAGNVRGTQGPQGFSGDTAILVVTSNTRPSNPFTGSMIYETDTHRLYSWNGTAWVYRGGTIICNSATRPSAPFAGLAIYETDTKRSLVWDGAAWVNTGGIHVCTSTTRPTNPFTGMMIFETNTNNVLFWAGISWYNPSPKPMSCKVYRAAPQGIGSGVTTNIIWTNEEYDSNGIWSLGGAADQFVIPAGVADGGWRFTLNANFSINGAGIRTFGILHSYYGVIAAFNDIGNPYWYISTTVSGEASCRSGDTIKAYGYQSSGSVMNFEPTPGYNLNFSCAQII